MSGSGGPAKACHTETFNTRMNALERVSKRRRAAHAHISTTPPPNRFTIAHPHNRSSSALQQHGVRFPLRNVERRPAVSAVSVVCLRRRVDVSVCVHEVLRDFNPTLLARTVQRRLAFAVGGVNVGFGFDQHCDDRFLGLRATTATTT